VALRFLPGEREDVEGIAAQLRGLLGDAVPVEVKVDRTLAERSRRGKIVAYRSEAPRGGAAHRS
jgi:hypothetical protein